MQGTSVYIGLKNSWPNDTPQKSKRKRYHNQIQGILVNILLQIIWVLTICGPHQAWWWLVFLGHPATTAGGLEMWVKVDSGEDENLTLLLFHNC